MINFEQFISRAGEGNVVVLTRTLMADLLTPVSTYLMLRSAQSPSFLLESVEPNEKIGRYSFIGSGPVMTVRARRQEVTITRNGSTETRTGSILDVLREESDRFKQAFDPETGAFARPLATRRQARLQGAHRRHQRLSRHRQRSAELRERCACRR